MFWFEVLWNADIDYKHKIIHNILNTIEKNIAQSQNGILNIVFVSDKEIQKLNNDYRWKNDITDVLSFHYYDEFSQISREDIAGEIILSENKIIDQAQEYGLWKEHEFYKLLIHSILHILWYDHIQDHDYVIMQEKEDLIWKEVFGK